MGAPILHPQTSPAANSVHASLPGELLLSAIVDSSDDGIIGKSLDGTITSWNKGAERIFGFRASEIIGRSVLELIPPDRHAEELEILEKLRRGERIEHFESIRRRKDGSVFPAALTISPIKTADGRIIGASKIVRDVTQQHRSAEATQLLAAIVESSDDAIVSKNLDGIITSWNRGAQRIFGYTPEETIGRSITMLIPPERLDEEPEILARLRRGERVDHFQTIRVRKGGERFHVSLTISPIRDAHGRIVGASKVARDITKEKTAVAQMALANEELRRADRMKSEFLAIMSHELRTPLNSIIGFASMLRQERHGPLTDEQKKQLHLIHASGKHLLNLINDLLDLSRIESGRLEVSAESFLPGDLIQDAVRTLEFVAAQKNLTIHQSVAVDQPVSTDRKRLFQIVLNLLNNAIKFTPQGSVNVRAWFDGDHLAVSVADTGIGIPKEKHSELFQAFRQLESSARRRYEGTGLGLYLSQKLARLLGGEITMESELNRGSVFTVRIPIHLPAENLPVAQTPHSAVA